MKNKSFFLFGAFAAFLAVMMANGQQLTILHTNDMHSKLNAYGPEREYSPLVTGNDSTIGGFARLATLIGYERATAPENTLLLDAGDFLMGTLFHVPEEETGFQLHLMKKMGYDYITLGNHEFDFGPAALARIIQAADKRGGLPQIVASNLLFSEKSAEDDALEHLYNEKYIQPYVIVEKDGLKIAIIGVMGLDAAEVAPASSPVTFSNPFKTAAKLAKQLKSTQKADLVILLSHSGIYPLGTSGGYTGEDIEMAGKAPLIDIIISGHTHVATPEYILTGNTYIVQTGCDASALGVINLNVENGKISEFDFSLKKLDDSIKGDSTVQSEIESYISAIDKDYLFPAGLSYKQVVAATDFNLVFSYNDLQSSNLGPFLADASWHYLKNSGNNADFTIVASGTIRSDIPTGMDGLITTADIFRVMSLGKGYDKLPGYPLAKIYLTGREVKKLMEILVISRAGGGDGFLYPSGIKATIDTDKGFLKKVQKIEINSHELDYSKKNDTLYSLAANTYLLGFIGRIKKMSHGLVKITPKDLHGNPVADMKNQLVDIDKGTEGIQEAKEWIAVIEYMKTFEKNDQGIPVIPEIYRESVSAIVDIRK
ncbi:MAG: bifunctional metallophosphatase/5'-nucleotidase [Bacteroidales bacterium]|nr:bifunctional metallophosphatase/5'-nucleotidase [Bacteroidales bacterium]